MQEVVGGRAKGLGVRMHGQQGGLDLGGRQEQESLAYDVMCRVGG